MRKLIWLVFVFVTHNVSAQQYLAKDSLRSNELSFSVLPVIGIMTGSFRSTQYTNFNLGYRHYFKKNYVLRTAVVLFPTSVVNPYESGNVFYDRTVGNKNVFRASSYHGRPKWQFDFGFEKIYKYNRLIHGWGAEALVNHANISYDEHYFYRYLGQGLNIVLPSGDTTNYNVDSLGNHWNDRKIGMGIQVFYSVRYKISKRCYLSATIGPSFSYSLVNHESYRNSTRQTVSSKFYSFEFPNMGFISDVSICYRF